MPKDQVLTGWSQSKDSMQSLIDRNVSVVGQLRFITYIIEA